MRNELEHHGILGMHWGVRRYQNEDGTWTNAGKQRYDDDYRANNVKKYGVRGEKRIDRRIQKGDSVKVAEAKEQERMRRVRRGSKVTGRIVGAVAGLSMASCLINYTKEINGGKSFVNGKYEMAMIGVSAAAGLAASYATRKAYKAAAGYGGKRLAR